MPNHITTQITAPTEVIAVIARGYTTEEIQDYKDGIEDLRKRELTEWFTAERRDRAVKNQEATAVAMLT